MKPQPYYAWKKPAENEAVSLLSQEKNQQKMKLQSYYAWKKSIENVFPGLLCQENHIESQAPGFSCEEKN